MRVFQAVLSSPRLLLPGLNVVLTKEGGESFTNPVFVVEAAKVKSGDKQIAFPGELDGNQVEFISVLEKDTVTFNIDGNKVRFELIKVPRLYYEGKHTNSLPHGARLYSLIPRDLPVMDANYQKFIFVGG